MGESNSDESFDSILLALNWRGLYQIYQLTALLLQAFPSALAVSCIIFTGFHVPFHCKELNRTSVESVLGDIDTGLNITYHECDITIITNMSDHFESKRLTCLEGYEYGQAREMSLVSEWDLVCENESLGDLLQTFYMIGLGVGAAVFAAIADMYGRKFTAVTAGVLSLAVGVGMSYVPQYAFFAAMKMLQAAALMGLSVTGTSLSLELVPAKQRSTISVAMCWVWSGSTVIYAVFAYLTRNVSWRIHQLAVGLSSCYFVFLPWLLDESNRWLAAKKKYHLIERNLKKACRINRVNEDDIMALFREKVMPHNVQEHHSLLDKDSKLDLDKSANNGNIQGEKTEEKPVLQIFKDRQLLLVSAVTWFTWLTDSLTYYGLYLNSTTFHSDKYIGFGLNCITDVLSVLAFWLTVDRFGRKRTCQVFHLMAGLSLIASVVFDNFKGAVPSFSVAVTTFSLLGKFAIATSYNIIWLYTPEIFPTSIRNVGIGLASVSARVGGLFAPFTRTVYRYFPWVPGSVFGTFCIVVTLLVRFLPETKNQELPQTIQEMKQWIRKQRETVQKSNTPDNDT
ncbi:solute carrier family 22 member 20-like [Haliotis asinina]|uniref:solute carrier family 22 member 20-like n=1 Tax=Haliotis asinina TaxID=109174 RepID=UPI00353232B2